MTGSLSRLLLQLSEAGVPALLWGRQAKPYFGSAFDHLLECGLLVEEAPATEWDVCKDCECGLEYRPIIEANGHHIAACPLDQRSSLVLDDDDLRNFRIVPAELVRKIATVSGLGTKPSEIAKALWHLGITPNKRAVFLALSRAAVLQAGLLPLVRGIAQSSPVTLLIPELPAADRAPLVNAGLHMVPFSESINTNASGVSFALQLDRLVPGPATEPVLILNKARQTMILDGHEAALPQRAFDLLWLLAGAIASGGGVVSRPQIEQHLWGRQVVDKTAAADAIRDLREKLAAMPGGKKHGGLIETRNRQGYILLLAANAIQLIE